MNGLFFLQQCSNKKACAFKYDYFKITTYYLLQIYFLASHLGETHWKEGQDNYDRDSLFQDKLERFFHPQREWGRAKATDRLELVQGLRAGSSEGWEFFGRSGITSIILFCFCGWELQIMGRVWASIGGSYCPAQFSNCSVTKKHTEVSFSNEGCTFVF